MENDLFIDEYDLDHTVCDGLLKLYDDCKEVSKPGAIGSFNQRVDHSIKKCTDLFWDDIPKTGIKSHPKYKDEQYLNHLMHCVWQYSNKYLNGYQLVMYGGPRFQYYQPNEAFYREHFDAMHSTQSRVVAYITYLNTLTDGGGTYFTHQQHTVQPTKGKTILFPPHYTHRHKGIVSPTQHKYIITGWFTWYNK